jgi:hypothetical protein
MDVEKLVARLDGLLTKDFSTKSNHDFQIDTELTSIDDLALGIDDDPGIKIPILFSRLAVYFDAGLLFLRDRTRDQFEDWSVIASFHLGVFFPIDPDVIVHSISLPVSKVGDLKKSQADLILDKLKLNEIKKPNQNFFFIRINEHLAFGLFLNLAEPWSKVHIEKIHRAILKSLSSHE